MFSREIELVWKPLLKFILDKRSSKNTLQVKSMGLRMLLPAIRYPMIISSTGALFCEFLSEDIAHVVVTSSS